MWEIVDGHIIVNDDTNWHVIVLDNDNNGDPVHAEELVKDMNWMDAAKKFRDELREAWAKGQ